MDDIDSIMINGIEFYAYHGHSDEEQTVGHRYIVDVCLGVGTHTAGLSDRLADTICYAEVTQRIVQVGTSERFRLLEALADRISGVLLAEFPSVRELRLSVRKRCPPINAIVESVGVEILRRRSP